MNKVRIPYSGEGVSAPSYETPLSSGGDLRAKLEEDLILSPGKRVLVPTGLRIELPEGFEAQVRPRSGLAIRDGILVLNTPGTIDADYRGEIQIILCNLGEEDFTIRNGDRIAQLVIAPVVQGEFVHSEGLTESQRGSGGFGSTGKA